MCPSYLTYKVQFVCLSLRSRRERNLDELSPQLPFDVSRHPSARSHIAQNMISRLREDVAVYAQQQNGAVQPELKLFFDTHISQYVRDPTGQGVRAAIAQVQKLVSVLVELRSKDLAYIAAGTTHAVKLSNYVRGVDSDHPLEEKEAVTRLGFALLRRCGLECSMWFEYLVASTLSSDSGLQMKQLNPFLSGKCVLCSLFVVSLLCC